MFEVHCAVFSPRFIHQSEFWDSGYPSALVSVPEPLPPPPPQGRRRSTTEAVTLHEGISLTEAHQCTSFDSIHYISHEGYPVRAASVVIVLLFWTRCSLVVWVFFVRVAMDRVDQFSHQWSSMGSMERSIRAYSAFMWYAISPFYNEWLVTLILSAQARFPKGEEG